MNKLAGTTFARETKAQGMSMFIYGMTGEYPSINRGAEFTEITLSPNQILHGQNEFLGLLESEPGEVRIKNSSEIFLPVIYKKYWPWAAAFLVAGGVMGALLKR